MSTAAVSLHAFAYGEHLEDGSQRSLGFRLLVPVMPQPWCAEVESLARQLQLAPYPDHWPSCDLFCSVLLSGGQRLIALARYGLVDHTPSQRRGGLELIGVLAPPDIDPAVARSVYEWIKRRRATTDNLDGLDGDASLPDVLASVPSPLPAPISAEPTPVLPVQLWREGVLLFASTAPGDPDLHLSLLDREAGSTWQWLPLVGADFPLSTYAARGPIIAWTPYLASVAVKLDAYRPQPVEPLPRERRRSLSRLAVAVLLAVVVLLASANLWQTFALQRQMTQANVPRETKPEPKATVPSPDVGDRERFAEALYELILEHGGKRELAMSEPQLQASYQQVVRDVKYRELRLSEASWRGRMAVGAVDVLSRRSIDRVEEAVRKALENNKLDPKLIKLVVDTVHEQLVTELKN